MIKPYLLVSAYSKYPGAIKYFKPILGIFHAFLEGLKVKDDPMWQFKDWAKQSKEARFIATNERSAATLVLIDPELCKEHFNKP